MQMYSFFFKYFEKNYYIARNHSYELFSLSRTKNTFSIHFWCNFRVFSAHKPT
jgi:hypothetical protein